MQRNRNRLRETVRPIGLHPHSGGSRRDPPTEDDRSIKASLLKGPIDCGWLDVLYRSNSVKVVKLALDIRRQTDLANKESVQLEERAAISSGP